MSNAPESQGGEDLLEKLTTAVSVDAASGPKASMAVARQVWRQRPGYWKSFFNRWKTTDDDDEADTVHFTDAEWNPRPGENNEEDSEDQAEDVSPVTETAVLEKTQNQFYESFIEKLNREYD